MCALWIIIIFWPTSTKPQAWILRNSYNGCNGCSFGRHGVLKRDRIPLLKSYRQALEQKCGFPGVFGDDSDANTQNRNLKKSKRAASKFQDFPGISMVFQDLCLFPGLSRHGILNIKIPELSSICTNPEGFTQFATIHRLHLSLFPNRRASSPFGRCSLPVSYTHLTLPTKRIV